MGSQGREAMYDCVTGCGVDPRNIASRIMDIRSQLAAEFVQDLRNVAEARAAYTTSTVHSDSSGRPMSGGPLACGPAAGPAQRGQQFRHNSA